MTTDAEARKIIDAYCRAHDYTLVTREQEHRRALVKAAEVAELEAEVERLRAELAAAESTIAVLEDPELRTALTSPTTGDYGPVLYPDAAAPATAAEGESGAGT